MGEKGDISNTFNNKDGCNKKIKKNISTKSIDFFWKVGGMKNNTIVSIMWKKTLNYNYSLYLRTKKYKFCFASDLLQVYQHYLFIILIWNVCFLNDSKIFIELTYLLNRYIIFFLMLKIVLFFKTIKFHRAIQFRINLWALRKIYFSLWIFMR